jgi:hypothetical protein
MNKNFLITLVIPILLSSCSQIDRSSYTLIATNEEIVDISNFKQCLKEAGIPFEVRAQGVYVPKNEVDNVTISCN